MAGSVLFIFFLDNLTGDIRNRTMDSLKLSQSEHAFSNVQYCDPSISEQVLKMASKEFNLTTVAAWTTKDEKLTSSNSNDTKEVNDVSLENLSNVASVENYLPETEKSSSEELLYFIADKYVSINVGFGKDNKDNNSNKDIKLIESLKNNTKNVLVDKCNNTEVYNSNYTSSVDNSIENFLESAPFLVAVFETLSNVTAQTCGGTLLASHWVLTAASCVNLLGSLLHTNMTNNISNADKSQYTVIANATNPLVDGTAHNVTQVLLHPEIPSSDLPNLVKRLHCSRKHRREPPSLALMRIEPGVDVQPLDIVEGTFDGTDLRVFGWVLIKNESGHDAMRAAWRPVRREPAARCSPAEPSALCLCSVGDTPTNVTQISSGCPVLALAGAGAGARVLAVAQTDDRAPLVATPVLHHAAWIKHVLSHR